MLCQLSYRPLLPPYFRARLWSCGGVVRHAGQVVTGDRDKASAGSLDQAGLMIVATATKDTYAFARLYDLTSPRVYGLVASILDDRAECDEVMQDAYLEVWRRADEYDPNAVHGGAWLFAIADRIAVERLSARGERRFARVLAEHPAGDAVAEADPATIAAAARATSAVPPPPEVRHELLTLIAGPAYDLVVPAPPARQTATQTPEASSSAPPGSAATPDSGTEPPAPLSEPAAADASSQPAEPPPSTEVIQTAQRRNWTRGLVVLAASVVVLVALGFAAAMLGNELAPKDPLTVAVEQIREAADSESAGVAVGESGSVTVHWSAALGEAVVIAEDLPALKAGEEYRVWLLRSAQTVAAGTLAAADDAGVSTTILDRGVETDDVVLVTVEPEASREPTTDPVARIPTS